MKASRVICPYCGKPAVLVDGSSIYPDKPYLAALKFWLCAECGAYVGTHQGTSIPLGTLADAPLRGCRQAAHNQFDKLWKDGHVSRSRAYHWLAYQLDIPPEQCHIGLFDEHQCTLTVRLARRFYRDLQAVSS